MALTSTLIEDFEWGTLNSNKWSTSISSDASKVSVSSLALVISHIATAAYNGIIAATTYDLTASSFYVQLVDAGNQSLTSHEAILGLQLDANNQVWFTVSGGNVSAYKKVASVQTQVGSSIAYNSTTHAWLRIREASGTIYWDTSSDGTNWTNRWSLVNPFAITSIKPYMQSGCWQTEVSGSSATFDNFNLQPGELQLSWSDYTWNKRIQYGDPQYNGQWSHSNVAVNAQGEMVLSLTNSGSSPVGAEIFSVQRGFGYGTYTCTINTRVDNLHKAVVVGGMFTFDFTRPPHYAEIDMGEVRDYASQPNTRVLYSHTWNNRGSNTFVTNHRDVTSDTIRTYQTIWSPEMIVFNCYEGDSTNGTLISRYVHTDNVPIPGQERVHFNVWVQNANTPSGATAIDVKLKSFSFSPFKRTIVGSSAFTTSFGMNYYHESMGYVARSDAQIRTDLEAIKLFTNKVKIYHNPYTNNGGVLTGVSLTYCQTITRIAKELGMTVAWVVNVDNSGGYLTDANWSDYVTKVQDDANYAASAGADEFFIGNEIAAHNNGDAGFTDLPTRIKALFSSTTFSGVKSYQAISSEKDSWISSGLGSMPKISFNVYSNEVDFNSIIQQLYDEFGDNLEIGEFSTSSGFETDAGTDQWKWYSLLKRRVEIMNNIGIKRAYVFEWRTSSTSLYGFAFLKKDDEYPNVNIAVQSIYMGRPFLTL